MEFLPADIRIVLQSFHYICYAYRFFSDHHTEFASMIKLFAINTKSFVLKDCLLISTAEEGI
jgi:hypothetical protein